jgi:hypothetical protein
LVSLVGRLEEGVDLLDAVAPTSGPGSGGRRFFAASWLPFPQGAPEPSTASLEPLHYGLLALLGGVEFVDCSGALFEERLSAAVLAGQPRVLRRLGTVG